MSKTDEMLEALRADQTDITQEILGCTSARDVCIMSKFYLSAQKYGFVIEEWIKNYLNLGAKKDSVSGDASVGNRSYEIKASISDAKGGFNYVQLRPSHNIDGYIILNYSIIEDEVIWLYVPHHKMIDLILTWGGYAHGTVKANGPITLDSIQQNTLEYAIRPNMHKPTTKAGKCWADLETHRVDEDALRQILHKT